MVIHDLSIDCILPLYNEERVYKNSAPKKHKLKKLVKENTILLIFYTPYVLGLKKPSEFLINYLLHVFIQSDKLYQLMETIAQI